MNLVKKYIRLERLVLAFIVTAMIIMSNQAAYAVISLAPPVEYFLGENYFPQNMSGSDFNNDGNIDYVVSGIKYPNYLFSIILGDGNGGFVQKDYVMTDFALTDIAVYDMNNDGIDDVILSDYNSNRIRIYYGDGTGAFLVYNTIYDVNKPTEMFGRDFNKDGVPDMVVGSESGLHIFIGKIEGVKWGIYTPTDYLPGIRINYLAVADFNNDGYDDIAADPASSGGIYIIKNNHDGTFITGTAYCPDVYVNSSIACGDFDKDGKKDIVIIDNYNDLRILKSLGDGSLTDSGIKYVLNQSMYETFVADINGDEYDDIVGTVNNDSIAVIEGNGDGTFKTMVTYLAKSSSYPSSVACADYDNDGALDIAAVEKFNNSAVFFRNMMMDCIKNIEFSSVEHRIGTANDVQITVSMQGVLDGSEIKASLISYDGIDLNPKINDIQTVTNNSAVLTLHITDNLALGTYKIKIEITGKGKTYESNYLIYDYGTIVWNTVNEKISENASECSINFSRINGGKGELNIDFSLGGTAILGKDYEKSEFSDGILFSDGYDNKIVTLKFKILNDDIFEGDETITMTLSPAPSSTVIPKGLPATATITIKDDETTPLIKIITPSAISGIASGTAKDSAALGLPDQVQLETEDGNFKANVTWDVDSSSYDPSSKLSQSFTIDGDTTLPYFVTNPSNLDLNVNIEVHVNEKIPGKFAVSAVSSIGGSTTGSGIYSEGASVTVKAVPDSGYKFVNWMENGVVVSTDALYSFNIGSNNITLTAVFDVITPKYTVVFIIDEGGNQPIVSVKEVLKGDKVGKLSLVPVRDGYDFIGWNTLPNGSGSLFTENTEVYSGVTVYAIWKKHDSSSGGSGSNVPVIKTNKITTTTDSKTKTTVSTVFAESDMDANGKATVLLSENDISAAVNRAVKEAEKELATAEIVIKIDALESSKSVETIIPKTAFDTISKSTIHSLTVSSPIGSITFDTDSLNSISKESTDDLRITVAKIDSSTLSDEARQIVGDRAMYELSVISGAKKIHNFNGNVRVSVPYSLKEGEDANSIVIYYLNSEGKPEIVTNSIFDASTGMVTFTTDHFSTYAVGYNKVKFADVTETAWYFEAVNFISARNITSGTDYKKFNPDAKLTRAHFLVMIMRAYGILPDENSDYNFSDVGNTYYTGYISAAKRLGITNGAGNNMFEPDKEITRQEMAVLLYNTLKTINKIPQETEKKQPAYFDDSNLVADWAKDAMSLFVGTGTINGSDNMLNPTSTATRSEMAQLLYNLLTN
jgi:uncharacterized repeat protein (TIGR02543 family)